MKTYLIFIFLTFSLLTDIFSQVNKKNIVNYEAIADEAFNSLNYQEAILNYTKAIKLNQIKYSLYFNRALAEAKNKEYFKSIEDYNFVLKNSKDESLKKKSAFNLGLDFSELNDYTAAIESFYNSISIGKSYYELREIDFRSYIEIADCKYKIRDYEGSIQDATKAIGIYQTKIDGYEKRARCFSKLGKKDNAFADFESIKKIEPENVWNLIEIGDYYFNDKLLKFVGCKYYVEARLQHIEFKKKNPKTRDFYWVENLEDLRIKCGQNLSNYTKPF